ncbi:MAG: hypothetical protein K9L68_08945 [Spirochaetales bacterium]|nr:hypothetical protein [Spirochaetales bacterium]MCF7938712.1 hypothetical protein [Spirochaetales bacterium]
MNNFFVGVDLGTSGIKAGLIDTRGDLLKSSYWDTEIQTAGPGKMEQSPEGYYHATLSIIAEVVEQSGINPADVAGLAVDGQMGGVIGIDKNFTSITGLDMGLDIRSEVYNEWMHRNYPEKLKETTCGSPRNTPKMIRWMKEAGDVYDKVFRFVTLSGYVVGRMCNMPAEQAFVDYTLLSFFGNEDAKNLDWSEEITGLFGLDRKKLPRVVNPWDRIGSISKETSVECGLKAGTPVFAGAGDQPAGFLGGGLLTPGELVDVSGSTTILSMCVEEFLPDKQAGAVMYMPAVVPGKYHAFTYINGGGMALPWFRDEFAGGMSFSELTELAQKLPPGSGNLLFLPYFGGQQCPYNPHRRGGFFGLNWGHRREHLFRSILEGLSYDFADGLSHLKQLFPEYPYKEIEAVGGGAKNPFWLQMKADVLGLVYRSLHSFEISLKGCAIIAGYGAGVFSDLEEASRNMNKDTGAEEYHYDHTRYKEYKEYVDLFLHRDSLTFDKLYSRLSAIGSE